VIAIKVTARDNDGKQANVTVNFSIGASSTPSGQGQGQGSTQPGVLNFPATGKTTIDSRGTAEQINSLMRSVDGAGAGAPKQTRRKIQPLSRD